jgi:hypothetical protein
LRPVEDADVQRMRVRGGDIGSVVVWCVPVGEVAFVTGPVDLLFPSRYSKDEQMMLDRWRACRECPELHAGVCGKCGCVMKLKVRLSTASCPIGMWGAES